MNPADLQRAPFDLDAEGLAWVEHTFAAFSPDDKLAQLFVLAAIDQSEAGLTEVLAKRPCGIHRFAGTPAGFREGSAFLQARSPVPLLLSIDVEFSENGSLAGGTSFPNQMAVAATGDPESAAAMGTIAGREGRYRGFQWSFTPVVDINVNPRNPAVNTRSFGSDPATVAAFAAAEIGGMQQNGFAAGAKHWPGDGIDDRDQHFVTSRNALPMDRWRETYGRVYRAAIEAGVKSIMAGHVTLPAYAEELGARRRSPPEMPASLNADLNLGLLRGEFGFNGLILSDATEMAGFANRGPREMLVPLCVENGCDVLLFTSTYDADRAALKRALADGRLSQGRVDDAVLRILALKASLGLHRDVSLPPEGDAALWSGEHVAWAKRAAAGAPTLVKDEQNLLPLRPDRHRRLLLVQQKQRMGTMRPLPPLVVGDLLRSAGFEVTDYSPGDRLTADAFDVALYVLAIEGASGKLSISVPWDHLHGMFTDSMTRLWQTLPSAFISLGNPYHLYETTDCPTYINAYSPIVPIQEAVVRALTGEAPFAGKSPVDPLAALNSP